MFFTTGLRGRLSSVLLICTNLEVLITFPRYDLSQNIVPGGRLELPQMLLSMKTLFTGGREQKTVCFDLGLFSSQQNQKEQHGNKPTSDFCWERKVIKKRNSTVSMERR